MEKKINDIIIKYKELRNDAWTNYRDICNQEQKEIGNIIDFKGKYLKIIDDTCIYLHVLSQYFTNDQERNNDFFIRLVGSGFEFYINQDSGYMYGEFDVEFTYELNVRNIKSNLENIEEISKEEFIIECKKHFTNAKKYFINSL